MAARTNPNLGCGDAPAAARSQGLNVDVMTLLADLERVGYAIREDALSRTEVDRVRAALDPLLEQTPVGRNPFEGFHTKRVYSPLAKTRELDELVLQPWIEELANSLIGPHTLSSLIGIHIGPGEVAQEIHYDAAAYPLPRSYAEVVFNIMWALDDFTAENGATVIYPESNHWVGRAEMEERTPVQATMSAGSVLIWTGRTQHGGGANHTDGWRLGLVTEYVAGWLRPHENIQASISPELAGTFPPRLQELIGYHLYPDFLGFVDGRHPRSVLARTSPSEGMTYGSP